MFAGTPRLWETHDLRSALLIGAVVLCALGLQAFFAVGTVVSPLGDAMASFDRAEQAPGEPAEALARADSRTEVPGRTTRRGNLPWEVPVVVAAEYRTESAGVCPR